MITGNHSFLRRVILSLWAAGLFLWTAGPSGAATVGNIDTSDMHAWSSTAGWAVLRPENGGVTVYPDHLEGYAWMENIGWIRMGSYSGGGTHTYGNSQADNYGVNHDGAGNLSGYAWSKNAGWIHFNPANGGPVTIDMATGAFDGYAWSENIGWIHFRNAAPAYKTAITVVNLSVSTNTGTEADTTAVTVTATASLPVTGAKTVDLAVTGTGITTADYTLSAGTVTIADGTTFGTATFTVSDDADTEGPEAAVLTISNPASGILIGSAASQNITITDDEIPGITVTESGGATSVNESGTTDTFTVVLDSKPLSAVRLSVESGDTGEVTVSGPALPLTFTPANWDTPQTVTLTGADDPASDTDQTTIVTISVVDAQSNDLYDPVADETVSVTTVNDDIPGITVTPTGGLTTTEAGGTAIFTVVLQTEPRESVTIPISSSDTTEGIVSPSSLTFTTADWNDSAAHTVTVTGQADTVNDGSTAYTVTTGPAVSVGGDYSGMDADDVSVTNTTPPAATTPGGGTPNPGTPNPGNPNPGNPDPGNPDPGTPDPGTPDPGTPDPGSDAGPVVTYNTGKTLDSAHIDAGTTIVGGIVTGAVTGTGTLKNAVIDATGVGKGITVGQGCKVTPQTVLGNPGMNLTGAITKQTNVKDPTIPILTDPDGTGGSCVADLVKQGVTAALADTGTTVTADGATGVVLIQSAVLQDALVPGVVTAVETTGETDGVKLSDSGNLVVVAGGIKTTLAPAAANSPEFISAVGNLGLTHEELDNGVKKVTGAGLNFCFRFDLLVQENTGKMAANTGTGAATFEFQGGSLRVVYSNGSIQNMVPFVHDMAALVSGLQGLAVTCDPSSGIITVGSGKGALSFLPDYILAPAQVLPKGKSVVFVIVDDANQDGIDDILMKTQTACQVLFALQAW